VLIFIITVTNHGKTVGQWSSANLLCCWYRYGTAFLSRLPMYV